MKTFGCSAVSLSRFHSSSSLESPASVSIDSIEYGEHRPAGEEAKTGLGSALAAMFPGSLE
jgi:hypothetical protein